MRLPKETKQKIIKTFGAAGPPWDKIRDKNEGKEGKKGDNSKAAGKGGGGAGGVPAQAALLTEKIKSLTEHFKTHKKDLHSMRGLMKMVSRRKKLLAYLKRTEPESYQSLIKALGLRK